MTWEGPPVKMYGAYKIPQCFGGFSFLVVTLVVLSRPFFMEKEVMRAADTIAPEHSIPL